MPQVFLRDVKKSFEGGSLGCKKNEIHLSHYEIHQLSPHYYTRKPNDKVIRTTIWPIDFRQRWLIQKMAPLTNMYTPFRPFPMDIFEISLRLECNYV